jgi:hypothetical protein
LCRAALADYLSARAALAFEMESRLGSDAELASAWGQARELNTEADVLAAEEVFPRLGFRSSSKVGEATRRMLTHEARTGHKVRRALRG